MNTQTRPRCVLDSHNQAKAGSGALGVNDSPRPKERGPRLGLGGSGGPPCVQGLLPPGPARATRRVCDGHLPGDGLRTKMAEEKDAEGTEALVAELHKKIKEAFEVFDHESNNTVDVREIGTIIRSLGCCPTEGELHDFIAEVEEEEPTGYIRFEKFIPVMTRVLMERRYRPIAEDVLLRAFEVLDPAKRGFLTKDELVKYMTEEGQGALFLVR